MATTTTTADVLVRVLGSDAPLPLPRLVIEHYFGQAAFNAAHAPVVRDVYEDLVRRKRVPAACLNDCFQTNRLDDLIHAKHTHLRSDAYDAFKEGGIVVGPTCHRPRFPVPERPVPDDDHCPTCGHAGCVTAGNMGFDDGDGDACARCARGICRKCAFRGDGRDGRRCWACWCTEST